MASEVKKMSFSGLAEVVHNSKVGPEHFLMRILCPELTRLAKPGQFVHIRCNSVFDPLLRRPISLHGIDYEKGTISLLYQVVGRGTKLLSEIQAGSGIDVMGPLGNGFTIPEKVENVLVIGGGIGVAPLFPLIQSLNYHKISQTILLGARTKDYIIGDEQLGSMGMQVKVATDDGSAGVKGYVTDLAEKYMMLSKPDYFFACGPNPMLKRVQQIAEKYGIEGQVSLEEYMGCGVGACLACVCKTKNQYRKVCTDGPVFKASEVIFDD